MARERLGDARFDFRGGTNRSMSDEILARTEVRRCENGRPGPILGSIRKVGGTQRIHTTMLGGATQGLAYADTSGGQLVAIAGGNLYYKTVAAADYGAGVAGLHATNKVRFAQHRVGATIRLFIADGANLKYWDGAALSAAVANAPASPTDIAVYKGRLFAIAGTKTLYASKVTDPLTWLLANGGFQGDVETFDAEALQGLIVVGSSLLLPKLDNIARFTGVDNTDIRIDTQSEGVSDEDGLIAPYTLIRAFEGAVFGVGSRGPWIATEAGLDINLGLAVATEFDFSDRAIWQSAVAHNDEGRRCIRLWIPGVGDNGNKTAWEYNYQNKTWSGPRRTAFAVTAAMRYLKSGGETTLIGGVDGWVREMEVKGLRSRDDYNQDGSGGTAITLDVELPPIMGDDPSRIKSMLQKQSLQADLGGVGRIYAYWYSEFQGNLTLDDETGDPILDEFGQPIEVGGGYIQIDTKGPGVRHYPYKLFAKGARIRTGFIETTDETVQLNGVWQPYSEGRKIR